MAVSLVGLVSACDSTTAVDPVDEVTVRGTVTDAAGFGEDGTWQGIEGASVTAYAVGADGQLQPLEGEATTDADGRYTLTTAYTERPIRIEAVSADDADERFATVIESGGATNGTVDAAPMTAQSTVQADVYDRLLATDSDASIADVHALVGEGAATSVASGATTVDNLATAVQSGVEAERAFAMSEAGGGISAGAADDARTARDRAYTDFRTQAATATTPEARRDAEDAFVDAYVRGYEASGLTPMQQAHASATGAAATTRFAGTTDADAGFATAHRGRSLAALSTSYGIEDEFRTAGATDESLGALEQARTAHHDALRGATTDQQFADANRAYQDAVSTGLATHGGFTAAQIDDAFAATTAARGDLDTGVAGAADAAGVAESYGAYYPAAADAAHTSLGGAAGEQSLGGNVVGTLGATAAVQ